MKSIGNSIKNLTENPGLAKAGIPGLDLHVLPSMNKSSLTNLLGGLMERQAVTKSQVTKFMSSFNKAFQSRSTGGSLGKKG